MAEPDIAAIIRDRAVAHGVSPADLLRIGQIESGLNPASANPRSSAKGLFQFLRGTWDTYGKGADPHDPVASADAGARFLGDNQRALQSAGLPVTPGTLYLSHFAGPGGAAKVLRADPSASLDSVLGPDAVRANPFLANMTVSGLRAWADRKMGETGSTATAAAPAAGTAAPLSFAPSSQPDVGLDAATLQALQTAATVANEQPPAMQPMTINFPTPPGLARARALARAMGRVS